MRSRTTVKKQKPLADNKEKAREGAAPGFHKLIQVQVEMFRAREGVCEICARD
jgi:hypothetical protein